MNPIFFFELCNKEVDITSTISYAQISDHIRLHGDTCGLPSLSNYDIEEGLQLLVDLKYAEKRKYDYVITSKGLDYYRKLVTAGQSLRNN